MRSCFARFICVVSVSTSLFSYLAFAQDGQRGQRGQRGRNAEHLLDLAFRHQLERLLFADPRFCIDLGIRQRHRQFERVTINPVVAFL